MKKTVRLWMLMALSVLCIGGLLTACSDKSEVEEEISKTIVSKQYKDYLSAGGLKKDAQQLTELVAHERLLELLFIKMESGDWKEPLFSTDEYSEATMNRYFEVLGEAVEHADEYEAAIKRLSSSGALGTDSPQTRGFDNIPFYTAVKLVGYLKLSGKACRAAIVGVVDKSGHAEDAEWLKERYEAIDPRHLHGIKDYVDFWQKFSKGELDDRACVLFGNLMRSDGIFMQTAEDYGVSSGGMIRAIAVPMITTGVNLVLNLTPTTTYSAEALEIGNCLNNLGDSIKAGGSVGGTLVKTGVAIANTYVNHCVNHPVSGGDKSSSDFINNGVKELGIGMSGDAADAMATSLDNHMLGSGKLTKDEEIELLKNGGQAKVEFTDKDKKSSAQVVVATDKDGKILSIGTPDSNGKTTVIVPAGKEVSITAIDGTGDKHTEKATVKAGETKTIEAATNESENIEEEQQLEKPSVSCNTTKLEFDADGGKQTFNVTYTGLFISAAVVEDEAEKWCSVDFDNNGKITVACKPNDGAERTCTVMVGAWNEDDGNDMVVIEVQVVQSGAGGDLSFIDWKKFRIDGLDGIYVDWSSIDGDLRQRYIYSLEETFVFPNKSLSIKKINDSEYEVIGICSDDTKYDSNETPDPDHVLKPESPYGIHYEVSFRVVGLKPSYVCPVGNFGLKDIRIKGYYKTLNFRAGDEVEEFEYYFEKTGPHVFEFDYCDNGGKVCMQTMDAEDIDNARAEQKVQCQYWKILYYEDDGDGGSTPILDFRNESYKLTSKKNNDSTIDIILRWD